jgi:hypothetical protein
MQDISRKISELEKELEEFKTRRQDQLTIFMAKSGLNDFLAETDKQIAYFQGQIDILKSLIENKPVESD